MSIVALSKVTLLAHTDEKDRALEDLQELGCLHLIPLTAEGAQARAEGPSTQAAEALGFLLSCPVKRRQVRDPRRYDPVQVEERVSQLQDRYRTLRDERDFLIKRLEDLEPWGSFQLPPVQDLDGYRLWFYIVPLNRMRDVEATDLIWQVVNKDNRTAYVVVLSRDEPRGMPVPRTRAGRVPTVQLEERLEEVELELQDLEAERMSLTRWCYLFGRSLDLLHDRAERHRAAAQTLDLAPVFGIQAWCPTEKVKALETYAAEHGMVLQVESPEPGEEPPTLLTNPPKLSAGEDLVTFYQTPSYWTWDPSNTIFFSFALFFGMILSDAGYALVLALVALFSWRKMGRSDTGRRWRILLGALATTTFIYGALSGSWFGVAPAAGTFFARIKILDLDDYGTLMGISVVIGCLHIALANFHDARRYSGSPLALVPTGWIGVVLGGLAYFGSMQLGVPWLAPVGIGLMSVGGLLVVVFAGHGFKPLGRVAKGALALTRLTTLFGDVLSYLRLFALGLATASLAVAFNDMAMQVKDAVPGVGLFFAILVLLVGHTMNLVLGIASGFIHGMRLNVIEFFNWALNEEGRLFRPFKRKETLSWNR